MHCLQCIIIVFEWCSSVGCCCWWGNQTERASNSIYSVELNENTDRYLIAILSSFFVDCFCYSEWSVCWLEGLWSDGCWWLNALSWVDDCVEVQSKRKDDRSALNWILGFLKTQRKQATPTTLHKTITNQIKSESAHINKTNQTININMNQRPLEWAHSIHITNLLLFLCWERSLQLVNAWRRLSPVSNP